MLSVRTTSIEETRAVAGAVAGLSRRGDLIVLAGEMGAGKTVFAQGFGARLGVVEPITSPTFNLVHSYSTDRLTLHHADVYRLGSHHELDDLALGELAEEGIVLVEWGDVVAGVLGDHLSVLLEPLAPVADGAAEADGLPGTDNGTPSDDIRDITLAGAGPTWAARWSALDAALREALSAC